jgi:hypothetical protein
LTTVALRTALVWLDEVMEDVVVHEPTRITVGNTGKPMFIVPNIGLPKDFAIVRPGNRGYLLTLSDRMRGTICLDGERKEVADLVRGQAGGFFATPISGKDWGVVDLDETGDYKLFFQFVPIEDAQPFFTKPVLYAGAGGYLISMLTLAAVFFFRGVHVDFTLLGSGLLAELAECLFRGWALATVALGLSALFGWLLKQEGDQQASFAFSVLLHAALLFMTYQLYDSSDQFVYPGPRSLTGNYLVTRLEEPKEEPTPIVATIGNVKQDTGAAAAKTPEKPKNTATKNDEGAEGGKGEQERARDPNANTPPAPPRVALFEDKNRKVLDNIIDRNLSTGLAKFNGIKGDEVKRGDLGFGTGTGTGVGTGQNGTGTTRGSKGTGTGGGGNAEGDFVSKKGNIDTGTNRPGGGTCAHPPCGSSPKEVKLELKDPEGDFGGLTAEEINRIVKARAGVFRACYQTVLNRSPGLGGKLVVHFTIGGDGAVKSSKTAAGSTLRNSDVESCVNSNIMRLKFPAKGGLANVNYPFLFQPGS